MRRLKKYFLGITLALNQMASAILGGDPNTTISARAGFARERGAVTGKVVCVLLDGMFFEWAKGNDPLDHCEKAIGHHWERRAPVEPEL